MDGKVVLCLKIECIFFVANLKPCRLKILGEQEDKKKRSHK